MVSALSKSSVDLLPSLVSTFLSLPSAGTHRQEADEIQD